MKELKPMGRVEEFFLEILSLIKTLIFAPIFFVVSLSLVFFVLVNGIGILTGFEDNPQTGLCYDWRHGDLSNFEYYYTPITPYACKKNGGLLQPALTNAINWLGKDHK